MNRFRNQQIHLQTTFPVVRGTACVEYRPNENAVLGNCVRETAHQHPTQITMDFSVSFGKTPGTLSGTFELFDKGEAQYVIVTEHVSGFCPRRDPKPFWRPVRRERLSLFPRNNPCHHYF